MVDFLKTMAGCNTSEFVRDNNYSHIFAFVLIDEDFNKWNKRCEPDRAVSGEMLSIFFLYLLKRAGNGLSTGSYCERTTPRAR